VGTHQIEASLPARRAGRRTRSRVLAVIGVALVLVRVAFVVLGVPEVQAVLHINSPYPNCHSARISTPEGREGTCAVRYGWHRAEVSVVVNRTHTLHMPGYDARILNSNVTPTIVPNANDADFPHGRGWLAAFHILITNTSSKPLRFDANGRDVDLLYPLVAGHALGNATYQQLGVRGRQGDPPGQYQPIPAHGLAIGWVTFVVPQWVPPLLNVRAADLEFYRPGHTDRAFNGQIRLWK
jgi:hypothetical protein